MIEVVNDFFNGAPVVEVTNKQVLQEVKALLPTGCLRISVNAKDGHHFANEEVDCRHGRKWCFAQGAKGSEER